MANHASAIKRHRQNIKRRDRNRMVKSTVRTAVKRAKTLADEGDSSAAKEALKSAEKMLARAASKGVIPKRTASRNTSRLSKKIK